MILSDAEKQRIYEEEKARIEARKQIKKEARARGKKRRIRITAIVGLVIIVILFIGVRSKDQSTLSMFQVNEKVNTYLYVNASSLNVRSGPGEDYDVIEKLFEGQQVPVYEIKGDWVKVQNSTVPGYVHKAYLRNLEESNLVK